MTLQLTYSRFALALVQERLGLRSATDQALFSQTQSVPVSNLSAHH